ncbi:hypothetical protein D7Y09_06710 [bacterium 1XD42-1]|nr:hypothetical protein D7X25_05475 [bacterium 1XD42-8]RKJ65233.1 hypothetical protein D7Y09_06710 [bacterium 1XD42-1]
MASKKMTETKSWKFGAVIGVLISNIIIFCFKILWAGTGKACKKYKPLIGIYIVLFLSWVFSWHLFYLSSLCTILIQIIFILIIVMGSIILIQEYPTEKKRKYFYELFIQTGITKDVKKLPMFLYENDISEYARLIAFYNLIPISEWFKIKEELEILMDVKIIDIIQSSTHKKNTALIIETQPLPNYIEWDKKYHSGLDTFNIGVAYDGIIEMDLQSHAHAFIAGETGSGKTNVLKCLINQALCKHYEVILIDFKRGVSFSEFSYYIKIYYEYKETLEVLKSMVIETSDRLDKFRELKVDNIIDYNKVADTPMNRIIIFIDELAELLKPRDKELARTLTDCIETLTRLSRAAGIHLLMGIQRPDSTIISGQIKNNVAYRICGRFVDKEPSRIMLGNDSASTLPNIKGRFMIKGNGLNEVQCFYFNSYGNGTKEASEPIPSPSENLDEAHEAIPSPSEKSNEAQETNSSTLKNSDEAQESGFNFNFSDIEK